MATPRRLPEDFGINPEDRPVLLDSTTLKTMGNKQMLKRCDLEVREFLQAKAWYNSQDPDLTQNEARKVVHCVTMLASNSQQACRHTFFQARQCMSQNNEGYEHCRREMYNYNICMDKFYDALKEGETTPGASPLLQ
eukprot:gnl/Spiro4/24802_TR12329_c0_g1_i1.p1 gnl/Spiro4/24802_TR12329_c0_g1~~gnl/Spiro4/24802_TR12329_c0_g1_i1.p1  ORF type:complete len:149 (+),score=15.54 gnl/Spiro4/24802_TR12329_c0_g1_i1:39-449(+)